MAILGLEEVTTSSLGGAPTATRFYALPGGVTATRDRSGLVYEATDALGTPIAALDLASGIVGEQLRAPYGQARYAAAASGGSGGLRTPYGFTGQREDTTPAGSSGLDDFNARMYDPVVGRFTSADAAQPGLGDPSGQDGYAYVGGRVENATDPTGNWPKGWKGVILWFAFALKAIPEIMSGAIPPQHGTESPTPPETAEEERAEVNSQTNNIIYIGGSGGTPEGTPIGPGSVPQGAGWLPTPRVGNRYGQPKCAPGERLEMRKGESEYRCVPDGPLGSADQRAAAEQSAAESAAAPSESSPAAPSEETTSTQLTEDSLTRLARGDADAAQQTALTPFEERLVALNGQDSGTTTCDVVCQLMWIALNQQFGFWRVQPSPTSSTPGTYTGGNTGSPASTTPSGGGQGVQSSEAVYACSFLPTTQVTTAQGLQPLGALQVGQRVWAYNSASLRLELQPIVHVWRHVDQDLIDLTLTMLGPPGGRVESSTDAAYPPRAGSEGLTHNASTEADITTEVIHTTAHHPFLTRNQSWVAAGSLVVGMQVISGDGTLGLVTGWRVVVGSQEMDNLEVAQDHTFLVGNGRWIVHNACEAIAAPRHIPACPPPSATSPIEPGPLRAEEASMPLRHPERPRWVERRRGGRRR